MTRTQVRRYSMIGTAGFAIGIVGVVLSIVQGSLWIALAAAVFLVAALLLLHRVGKSLS